MTHQQEPIKSQLGLILQLLDKDFKAWYIAKSLIENSYPYLERGVLSARFYSYDDKLEMFNDIKWIYQHYGKELLPDSVSILELKLDSSDLTYESLDKLAKLDEKQDKVEETMKKLNKDEIKLLKEYFNKK